MLTGIVSSRGFLKRLDDVGSLPVWSIDGSHLPDDMLALLDHLLDLAGTHGDPQARRPLQSDLLRRHREGPNRFVPWAVHSERPTRRLCEAKRHLKEGPGPARRVEHPHEVVHRAENLSADCLPDDRFEHRVLLRCHCRLCDSERPEHLPGRFAEARHQQAAIAGGDQDGKERPLTHAEDKLRTGKEQMRVPVTQLR